MRLAIATPLYPPEPGGPATYAKHLEEGLPNEGIVTDVVKFSDVRHLPKLVRHFVYYRCVLRAARNADAVLALDPVSVGLPALKAARKAGKPFYVKIVGDYAWEQGSQRFGITVSLDEFVRIPSKGLPFPVRVMREVQTEVAQSADRVIVPSEYLKGIIQAWGIPSDRITVIHNGIALPPELPVLAKREGKFLIVSAGRRVPWKGFEALERVVSRHESDGWRLFIASGLTREDTLGHIKAADVFVLNSTYEGLSHVLIEAMTLGVPVVATSAGGNPTLVENGRTGLLIPPQDDAALEDALMSVFHERKAAQARAQNGKARMEAFSVPHMIGTTAAFFKAQAV